MRFSKFVHLKEVDKNTTAVIHSVSMKLFFTTIEKDILLRLYHPDKNTSIDEIFLDSGDSSLSFQKSLIENKFLVEDSYNESIIAENIFNIHSGKLRIDTAYFFLTDSCNLNCDYCLVKKPEHKSFNNKTIKLNQAKEYINYFHSVCDNEASEYCFTFYGGEPLLVFELVENIIREVNEKFSDIDIPLKFILLTNGILLNEQIIDKCIENDIHLVISIDGNEEITQEQRFSNKGDYGILKSNIERVQEKKASYGLSCTIGKGQENNALNSFNYLVENIGAKNIGLNYIIDIENYPKSSEQYVVDLTNQLIEIHKKYKGQDIYEDRLARKIKAFTENNPIIKDCTGCGNQLVFTPNNKVGPCQSFALNGKYFVEFNQDLQLKDTPVTEWNTISPFRKTECIDCIALGFCGGGCPYRAYNRNGSIHSVDDVFCIHSKKLLDYFINESYDVLEKQQTANNGSRCTTL